jgi:polyhydroxyalkanoate synthesis repressor PhaR
MAEPRLIKKYPNRRLYDTRDSRYITLGDICRLVVDGESFEVVDQKSGDELTCAILLQVLAEQSDNAESAFSRDVLAQMIRVYQRRLPDAVRTYLQNTMSMFVLQHRKIDELLNGRLGADPVEALTELAEQSLRDWVCLNKDLLRAVATGDCSPPPDDAGDASKASG